MHSVTTVLFHFLWPCFIHLHTPFLPTRVWGTLQVRRCGELVRIFPSPSSHKYLKFFEVQVSVCMYVRTYVSMYMSVCVHVYVEWAGLPKPCTSMQCVHMYVRTYVAVHTYMSAHVCKCNTTTLQI